MLGSFVRLGLIVLLLSASLKYLAGCLVLAHELASALRGSV